MIRWVKYKIAAIARKEELQFFNQIWSGCQKDTDIIASQKSYIMWIMWLYV